MSTDFLGACRGAWKLQNLNWQILNSSSFAGIKPLKTTLLVFFKSLIPFLTSHV